MTEPSDHAGEGSGSEAEELLDGIRERRGYVLEFHRLLAHADPRFLTAYDALISSSYTDQRRLSKREKELAYVAMLTGLGAGKSHIGTHVKAAERCGVPAEDVLETIEMCLPECGVPKFLTAIEAWRDTYRALGSDQAATAESEARVPPERRD